MNCRLMGVNAAVAASEHLSNLKGDEIENGSLIKCMANQGKYGVLNQVSLSLSRLRREKMLSHLGDIVGLTAYPAFFQA